MNKTKKIPERNRRNSQNAYVKNFKNNVLFQEEIRKFYTWKASVKVR